MSDADSEDKQSHVNPTQEWSSPKKLLAAVVAGPFALAGAISAVAQLYDYVHDGKLPALGVGIGVVALGVCLAIGIPYVRAQSRAQSGRIGRWSTLIVIGAMAVSLATVLAVSAAFIYDISTQAASPAPSQSSADSGSRPSPASRAPAPATGSVESATLRAEPQTPGGCTSPYRLSGEVTTAPELHTSLWIVAILPGGLPNGLKDTLNYPKVRLEPRAGAFQLSVPANTSSGTRRGWYILVSADEAAEPELELSQKSDREHNETVYPDGRRAQLPVGAYEIARTADLNQTCP